MVVPAPAPLPPGCQILELTWSLSQAPWHVIPWTAHRDPWIVIYPVSPGCWRTGCRCCLTSSGPPSSPQSRRGHQMDWRRRLSGNNSYSDKSQLFWILPCYGVYWEKTHHQPYQRHSHSSVSHVMMRQLRDIVIQLKININISFKTGPHPWTQRRT